MTEFQQAIYNLVRPVLITLAAAAVLFLVAVLFLIVGSMSRASAHEAMSLAGQPLGWRYDGFCCQGNAVTGDCAAIPDASVTSVPGGLQITLMPGDHPLVTRRHVFQVPQSDLRRSPDGSADIKPGFRVGALVAIAKTTRTLSSGRRMPAWSYKCDGGKVVVAMTVNVTKGKHQSCGCKRAELNSAHYPGDTKRPEYSVYRQMLDRCYLQTAPNFKWYGGKGVTVCERWRRGTNELTGFQTFIADMGDRPVGLTLDRIDPTKPYEPANCRWATWSEQAMNRREHHMSPFEREALRKKRGECRRGEKAPNAILKDAQVAVIKRRLAEGARGCDLARQFGVSENMICGIKKNRNWTHVQPSAPEPKQQALFGDAA